MAALGRWSQLGFHPDLEINLSALSLERIDLPDRMAALARRHDVDPARVAFEMAVSRGLRHAAACPAPCHASCPTFRRLLRDAASGALRQASKPLVAKAKRGRRASRG
jgi:hypothetical protein